LRILRRDSFSYTISRRQRRTIATATVTLKIKPSNGPACNAPITATNPGDWTLRKITACSFNFVVSDRRTKIWQLLLTIQFALTSDRLSVLPKTTYRNERGRVKTITVLCRLQNAYGSVPQVHRISDGQSRTTRDVYIDVIAVTTLRLP
jgi:hypothetical protein